MPNMKKTLLLFIMPLCFAGCGSNNGSSTAPSQDSSSTAMVSLPYMAAYSSSFVPGKQADVATVLGSYKAWETNDMKAMRSDFGDSVGMHFPSGYDFKGTLDSFLNEAAKVRDSLSKVELTIYAWTSNHSTDKNEDWVNVWYREKDTYKTGKVDSIDYEDDNLLKGGKIVWVSSHSQKPKP
jgi:hypothetical protein